MSKLTVLFVLISLFISQLAQASKDVVVVVNKSSPVDNMSRSEVIDLFMGKFVAFPDGTKAQPVEVKEEIETKRAFYKQLVGLSMSRVNAYWARLKFAGKSRSALTKASEEEVIQYLEESNIAIGYIPRDKITPELKVVYNFDE